MDDLLYSLFKEPQASGRDFHAAPSMGILYHRPAVYAEENRQFPGCDGPAVAFFKVFGGKHRSLFFQPRVSSCPRH